MNKLETAGRRVHFRHDADVPHSMAASSATEKDEIAFSHLRNAGYGAAFGVLATGRACENEVVLTIDVAGETATIKTVGATLSAAVGNSDVAKGGIEQAFNDTNTSTGVLLGSGKSFGNAGCFGFTEAGGGTDEINEGLGARFCETRLRGKRVSGGSGLIVGHVLCIARLRTVNMRSGEPPGEQRDGAKNKFFSFHEYLVLLGLLMTTSQR